MSSNNTKTQTKKLDSEHWTKFVAGNHATTKLGARFHFRKLFLRRQDFSVDELEYILQYLCNETSIDHQFWWKALLHDERLEVLSRLKMFRVSKGDQEIIYFSPTDYEKDIILLYGSAEAKPVDPASAEVLTFPEGSIVGSLRLPNNIDDTHSIPDEDSDPTTNTLDSTVNWRRVKRERAFRRNSEQYKKLIINGPADYLILTASGISETISRATTRAEEGQRLADLGLSAFAGCARHRVFEPREYIVREGETSTTLFLITQGHCKAFVQLEGMNGNGRIPPSRNTSRSADAIEKQANDRLQDPNQLLIASLGTLSRVGDVSITLGAPEPATIQCSTTVHTLTISQEDFIMKATNGELDSSTLTQMKKVATEMLGFVLERIQVEAKDKLNRVESKLSALQGLLSEHERALFDVHVRHGNAKRNKYELHLQKEREDNSASGPILPDVVKSYKSMDKKRHLAPTKTFLASPKRMTREDKRYATAFASLSSSVESKSLGMEIVDCLNASQNGRNDMHESHLEREQQDETEDDNRIDFLVPTVTRNRRLHAKKLPMLPRYDPSAKM